jgi:hypothetical protein
MGVTAWDTLDLMIDRLSAHRKCIGKCGKVYCLSEECRLLGCYAVWVTILVTLISEPICSYETTVLTRATRCTISEDGILHSHRRENLKSYVALTGWAL